jgi:SRSO17 transposase
MNFFGLVLWHGWHRHVSMVMLAFAMMAVIRHRPRIIAWS